jgi:[ribosomal protein S5]-alanine N-acetyltransferase
MPYISRPRTRRSCAPWIGRRTRTSSTKPHWGRGFAAEAVALLMGWLQVQPDIIRIWATTDVDNARSMAVLVRIGLQREGVLRMVTYRPNIGGPPRDTVVFSWCKGEVDLT